MSEKMTDSEALALYHEESQREIDQLKQQLAEAKDNNLMLTGQLQQSRKFVAEYKDKLSAAEKLSEERRAMLGRVQYFQYADRHCNIWNVCPCCNHKDTPPHYGHDTDCELAGLARREEVKE